MCSRCDYSELLKKAGLNPLPNRIQVLQIIGNSIAPVSAQEIYAYLQRTQHINRVTLYRILDLLVEHELVDRISSGDRSFRYGLAENPNHPRHPHFYCTLCGHMECLDPKSLNLDMDALKQTFPRLIRRVEVRLDGICQDCLQRSKKNESV